MGEGEKGTLSIKTKKVETEDMIVLLAEYQTAKDVIRWLLEKDALAAFTVVDVPALALEFAGTTKANRAALVAVLKLLNDEDC